MVSKNGSVTQIVDGGEEPHDLVLAHDGGQFMVDTPARNHLVVEVALQHGAVDEPERAIVGVDGAGRSAAVQKMQQERPQFRLRQFLQRAPAVELGKHPDAFQVLDLGAGRKTPQAAIFLRFQHNFFVVMVVLL